METKKPPVLFRIGGGKRTQKECMSLSAQLNKANPILKH